MLWVLFTFPSRYLCAIGLGRVFSLGGWARRIHAGFHVPRATQGTAALRPASRTGLSPAAARLSRRFRSPRSCARRGPTTPPGPESRRFGLLPGRSPLLGESLLFSLPPGTKMFQFPGFASPPQGGWQPSGLPGCPIQVPADQRPHAPPRGFSQLAAPFIAFPSHRHPPCALSCFRPSRAVPRGTHTLELPAPASKRTRRGRVLLYALFLFQHVNDRTSPKGELCVENNGFEPLTPCLQSRCSSQLS